MIQPLQECGSTCIPSNNIYKVGHWEVDALHRAKLAAPFIRRNSKWLSLTWQPHFSEWEGGWTRLWTRFVDSAICWLCSDSRPANSVGVDCPNRIYPHKHEISICMSGQCSSPPHTRAASSIGAVRRGSSLAQWQRTTTVIPASVIYSNTDGHRLNTHDGLQYRMWPW